MNLVFNVSKPNKIEDVYDHGNRKKREGYDANEEGEGCRALSQDYLFRPLHSY